MFSCFVVLLPIFKQACYYRSFFPIHLRTFVSQCLRTLCLAHTEVWCICIYCISIYHLSLKSYDLAFVSNWFLNSKKLRIAFQISCCCICVCFLYELIYIKQLATSGVLHILNWSLIGSNFYHLAQKTHTINQTQLKYLSCYSINSTLVDFSVWN